MYLWNEDSRPENRLQEFDHGGPLGDVEDTRGGQREVVLVQVQAQRREQSAESSKRSIIILQ